MKTIIFTLIVLVAVSTGAFSQQRNCGTMDYLQTRMQKDPTLAERMAAEEAHIQKWTEEHPQIHATFPILPGFQQTGNESMDRASYADVKASYEKDHPTTLSSQTMTAEEIEKARAERKKNKMIPVQQ